MSKSAELFFPDPSGNSRSGIRILYIKSRDTLYISGWYDDVVGIGGTEISFDEFCQQLKIMRTGEVVHR